MKIKVENVSYIYNQETPFEKKALDNINIDIEKNEFIGLIGHTGSGKSTFVQHLNALVTPTSGKIYIDDLDITDKKVKLREVRQRVGLVFQYPEYQLFEETIYKDIAFGPENLNLDKIEVEKRVRDAMEIVGLDYETMKDYSPFELSGGQKRRVAIAGVLAMKPQVLVLDEPTAGLDPHGRDEILGQIDKLYKQGDITIILVSHSMEDIAKLANRVIVFSQGKVMFDGDTREAFSHSKELEELNLGVPQITKFMQVLREKGIPVRDDVLTIEEAKIEIVKYLRGNENA